MRVIDSSQYIDKSLYLMSTSYQIQCNIMDAKTCSIPIMSISLWLLKNHLIQCLTVLYDLNGNARERQYNY